MAVEPSCSAAGANCAEQTIEKNIDKMINMFFMLSFTRFFKSIRAMSATTFATLSALEVILFGENYKAIFKIIKRSLAIFHFHFTKTIATQAIAELQCCVLTFITVEGHLAAMASRYVFGHTGEWLFATFANFLVKGFHTLWLFNFRGNGSVAI